MNNKMKLITLGITPFIIGTLINFLIVNFQVVNILILPISILFYVYWFWVGTLSAKYTDSLIQSMLIGNSFGIISISALMVSGVLLGKYMSGIIGMQIQMYFLPSIRVTAIIVALTGRVSTHMVFIVSFIIMLVVYYFGYKKSVRRYVANR
jgi:hypothetical protein